MSSTPSIAAKYVVQLYNTSGTLLAVFDSWSKLSINHKINDVSTYTIEFVDTGDSRFDLFELDGIIKIYRSVPGCDLDSYLEFAGLHRKVEKVVDENGERVFISSGVDFNDLLRRRIINYLQGTIRADKENMPADTAMAEYVEENCGGTAQAYTLVGRMTNGYITGFTVGSSGGVGDSYTNINNAFRNLLDVLKEIADYSKIDFNVELVEPNGFHFDTYPGGLGENRTVEGLDTYTGLNPYGNAPVVFALEYGNVLDIDYKYDRISEDNVISVLGPGTGSERIVYAFSDPETISSSPWNRHEFSVSGGGELEYYYQYRAIADEELAGKKIYEKVDFTPLQQPSTLYGLHYWYGDRVTVMFDDRALTMQLREVKLDIGGDGREEIDLTFSEVSVPTD